MKKVWISLNALLMLGLIGACGPKGDEPNVELIQDMMDQPALKAQEQESFFADGIGMRVPPSNTVPVGHERYRFEKDPEAAGRELKNPLANNFSDEVLLTGQNYFNINCMVCHGAGGRGDGPIKPKYPLPIPSLVSDKIRGWPDGKIYHVIVMGQGTMGPYRSHVPAEYRWQVVNYIRHLQKKGQ